MESDLIFRGRGCGSPGTATRARPHRAQQAPAAQSPAKGLFRRCGRCWLEPAQAEPFCGLVPYLSTGGGRLGGEVLTGQGCTTRDPVRRMSVAAAGCPRRRVAAREASVELIVEDAEFVTMAPGSGAESMLVRDGRIAVSGAAAAVRAAAGPGAAVVRLGGATGVPGLIDAHCHVMQV